MLKAVSISTFLLAPVSTIFPETKISRTSLGSIILYTSPGNTSGSYEQYSLCLLANCSKSIEKPTSQDPTTF